MSEKSKEALRREVVQRRAELVSVISCVPMWEAEAELNSAAVGHAFDRYDEAIRAERPAFDGDEAEVRERLVRKVHTGQWTIGSGSFGSGGNVATVPSEPIMALANPDGPKALTLLDAKDAEIARLEVRLREGFKVDEEVIDHVTTQRDEALSKLERAEQALAERDGIIAARDKQLTAEIALTQKFVRRFDDATKALAERDAAIEPFKAFAAHAVDANGWKSRIGHERICDWFGPSDFKPFLKPEAVDPLVAIFTEIARGPNRPSNEEEEAAAFREALTRSGGSIVFEGDDRP